MDYIIETENLTKRYGTATVVDKVNLHVPKGKIYGLLGRNGAGKTTAMKMMLQLAFPTEGTVRLFGTNYKENIHTLYSKVGSIIETPGFYSNLTGYENLQILAKLRGGVSKSGVEKALEVVGLHKEKRKVFSDYSLGMKQRLGIAAAIMHEPELLILDEPINGLDPIGIVEIRSFLSELSHNHGITIFISSHVLSEIEQIADIIGVMHEGHLVEEVNISELHKRNRKYIQFDLSDSEIAGKILENHYHMTDFTVQDGTVRIYDFSSPSGKPPRPCGRWVSRQCRARRCCGGRYAPGFRLVQGRRLKYPPMPYATRGRCPCRSSRSGQLCASCICRLASGYARRFHQGHIPFGTLPPMRRARQGGAW